MKIKLYNQNHLKKENINDYIIRVKAIMINNKDEVLLGEAFGTIQFPGGHLEESESLINGLKREIKEETGIILKEEVEPFFAIKYYLKNYPVIGNNRSIEIYYFLVKTDEVFNTEKTNLDDQERNGNFKLQYVPLKDVKYVLKNSIPNNQINKIVVREMNLALKEAKKIMKRK